MNDLRAWPDRGTYLPGQLVQMRVLAPGRAGGRVRASISHLTTIVANLETHVGSDGNGILEWAPPPDSPRGYGVDFVLQGPDGLPEMENSTAFDVLGHWTQRPRYGFVTDFGPNHRTAETLDSLLPFHVNALQFYDWQFRHNQLVAPQSDYEDALGRHLSLGTVRSLVKEAGARGMASMAYSAVYAASLEFQKTHPEWALYDDSGRPLEFEGFLGYMDPNPGRPWAEHLLRQCEQAINELGFDGIHLDQYGEPRRAFDEHGVEVDLPSAFGGFIEAFKLRLPNSAVTLNAVKNWPMEALAASSEDFYYVELWPDTPTYRDLRKAVTEARATSLGKPVVVAIYVPADQPANIRLIDAVIFASGGSRIELGEQGRLLADPYFPKHQPISTDLATTLRGYWDVAVRYGELLFASEPAASGDFQVEGPEDVWTTLRYTPGWLLVSLVNMRGLSVARWDEKHPVPQPLEDAEMRVETSQSIARVWWIDPDSASAQPQDVEWSKVNGHAVMRVPKLSYWGLVLFELATDPSA